MARQNLQSPASVSAPRSPVKTTTPSKRKAQRTKKQIAVALLERTKGASIAEIQRALGWQAHSVRGFLAGTVRKMPKVILISSKAENGTRRYRIQAAVQ